MEKVKALRIILAISVAGMLFSGYLSWNELVANVCVTGDCTYVLGLPSCVYGFVMYFAVFVLCIAGLRKRRIVRGG